MFWGLRYRENIVGHLEKMDLEITMNLSLISKNSCDIIMEKESDASKINLRALMCVCLLILSYLVEMEVHLVKRFFSLLR